MKSSRLLAVALLVSLPYSAALQAAICTFGFLPGTGYTSGTNSGDIAVGLFNADSYVDAAILNRGQNKVTILLGTAGGGFTAGTDLTVPNTYGDIIAGDVNGDGKVDLGVAIPWSNDFTVSPHIKVFLGNGDGTFNPVAYTNQQLVFQNPERMAPGKFDSDGLLDVVVIKYNAEISSMVSVGNNFAQKAEYTTSADGGVASDITAGDFDHDGKLDVVVAEIIHNRLFPFWGNGNGTFTQGTAITMTPPFTNHQLSRLAAGDFNGDGYADLAVNWRDPFGGPDLPPLMIMLSNGAARTFASPVSYGSYFDGEDMAVQDMNADGKLDVIVGSATSIDLFLGNGDGTLQTQSPIAPRDGFGIAIADFDLDGAPDIAGTSFSGGKTWVYLASCGWVTLNLYANPEQQYQGSPFTILGGLVSPPAAAATGTITLKRDTTVVDSDSLNSSTVVSYTDSTLEPDDYQFTFEYSGDARYLPASRFLFFTVQPAPFSSGPPLLSAFSNGGAVSLTWIGTANVDHYEIWRNSGAGYAMAGTSPVNSFTDNTAPSSSALLYKVRGVTSGGSMSNYSPVDIAITYTLTDETITPHSTKVKLAHLTQLRTALNAARTVAGFGSVSWAEPSPTVIKASHWLELRGAIAALRTSLGMSTFTYTRSPAAGLVINATDVTETRAAIR